MTANKTQSLLPALTPSYALTLDCIIQGDATYDWTVGPERDLFDALYRETQRYRSVIWKLATYEKVDYENYIEDHFERDVLTVVERFDAIAGSTVDSWASLSNVAKKRCLQRAGRMLLLDYEHVDHLVRSSSSQSKKSATRTVNISFKRTSPRRDSPPPRASSFAANTKPYDRRPPRRSNTRSRSPPALRYRNDHPHPNARYRQSFKPHRHPRGGRAKRFNPDERLPRFKVDKTFSRDEHEPKRPWRRAGRKVRERQELARKRTEERNERRVRDLPPNLRTRRISQEPRSSSSAEGREARLQCHSDDEHEDVEVYDGGTNNDNETPPTSTQSGTAQHNGGD